MTLPGFTAEVAMYRTSTTYRSCASQEGQKRPCVTPAAGIALWGGLNGPHCHCSEGHLWCLTYSRYNGQVYYEYTGFPCVTWPFPVTGLPPGVG